jgi:ceramide glucosyltransferase
VILNLIAGSLAVLSLGLTVWQWLVARRFPLHRRLAASSASPAVTLLKPLKGCDAATEECLRSWLAQQYAGPVQTLFGVAEADDPACAIVRRLLQEFPRSDAQLVVCGPRLGANAKVSQLVELEGLAKHDFIVISDADVRVPLDLLANLIAPLCHEFPAQPMGEGPGARAVGMVCCFYRLANPTTLAMQWEAVAVNADFWSQVLQSESLKPIDFALGAVMAMRRTQLAQIGGFRSLVDCLADDYQLGNRLARHGYRIALSPVVVECWSAPMGWAAVWKHQLRWARTIRVCQPLPYFFSILSNALLWPLVWLVVKPSVPAGAFFLGCCGVRILTTLNLAHRLTQRRPCYAHAWLVPIKDLLQTAIWLLAFLGNRIEWRGQRMRLRRDGTLYP